VVIVCLAYIICVYFIIDIRNSRQCLEN